MKKFLLLFLVVLISCSDNSDEMENPEPKRIGYLSFINNTGGFLRNVEISFGNYEYVINSDSKIIEVDLGKLNQSSGTDITLVGKVYDSWMTGPDDWKETINAVFREDEITRITVYKYGYTYNVVVTYV